MSRPLKIAVALFLVVGLGFPAYAGYNISTTDSKLTEARQEIDSARSGSRGWAATEKDAQSELQKTEQRAHELAEAVRARASFDSSLEAVKEQLQLSAGSVPIDTEQKRIIKAQSRVLKSPEDGKIIEAQAAVLDSIAAELKGRSGR